LMRTVALAALIFTISVCADESDDSKEFGENGIGLLNKQAHALRSARRAEKAKEWAPMDKTFKDFTVDPEAEKEEDEKEDKELQQSPKELGFPTYDENGLPDLNLVQMNSEDWTPTGQADLKDEVKAAHEQDDQDKLDSDHLSGEHLLSSVGIEGEEEDGTADPTSSDFGDLNLVQVQGSSSDWVPKGQSGMKEQIEQLKAIEKKDKLQSDGLKGRSVLSSVGMKGDKDEALEFEFVQDTDADWVPKNPLSQEVEQIKQDEHDQQLKDDGLKGSGLLSSVGMQDDSKDENGDSFPLELVQQWQPAPLIGGQHKKQAVKPQHLDVPPTDEDAEDEFSSDEAQDEEYDKLGEESMGTDILGAGDMAHAKKQEKDSMESIGALSLDDLKL